ncbi:MAG: succinate dehydrogenase, cytochrome b556 subunit [Alphaproteobacteria bacterium]|jgi:succinate dehydrogenase / fumarate reductase cytochrome b subunit|nr:succinate dehydrogenase, cytochrome b556 subunit [Alphaproteobacteria bacterium]
MDTWVMDKQRPLSPHLQIYKPQITSVLSIFHRFTGVAVAGGMLTLVWWLVCLETWKTMPEYYEFFHSFFSGIVGRLFLIGVSLAFFYHLSNGIRHLLWDMGYGYDITTVEKTGWMVVFFTLIITALFWVSLLF